MQPTATAPRLQAGHRANVAMRCTGGGRSSREVPSLRFVMVGVLVASLTTIPLSRAGDIVPGAGGAHGASSGELQVAGAALGKSLNDSSLASIRGRYVDARVLDEGVGNFVILWDERTGQGNGSDGKGTGRSISNGLGNQQSTTVTTRRGQ